MKLFFKILYSLPFIILCLACGKNQQNLAEKAETHFKTRPDTELYFKNVRQLYYDLEEQANTKLNLYRFAKRVKKSDKLLLNLAIVHNWRYNEAYLLLETNPALPKNQPFRVFWRAKSGKQGEIVFKNGDKTTHFEFANAIYQGILNEYSFYQLIDNQELMIFNSATERAAFRITMLDYLKLIGKL
jgi:hypothetical protein